MRKQSQNWTKHDSWALAMALGPALVPLLIVFISYLAKLADRDLFAWAILLYIPLLCAWFLLFIFSLFSPAVAESLKTRTLVALVVCANVVIAYFGFLSPLWV